ncbi:MAG TPA: 5'-nucleotidase C-terminal domain-containing protein [bacterium]|nr:5'-nucleotidase C-terminal domain-containing protein [bacterium]
MKFKKHFFRTCPLFVLLLLSCSAQSAPANATDHKSVTLTIAHVNDTHSHIEPTTLNLKFDSLSAYVQAGGLPRLNAKIKELRQNDPNLLFLHAGDLFQGTIYFQKFQGLADLYFFEAAGLDALTVGNHEFDKGPDVLNSFAEQADFPLLAANIVIKEGSSLTDKIRPFIIKEVGGEKIAIIGLGTPQTKFISSPGELVSFDNPVTVIKKQIEQHSRIGINKILVLSHLGFEADIRLARSVPEIDVIIGGHSHTQQGPFKKLGLHSFGPYPLIVQNPANQNTLIVQAWQNACELGVLHVTFDEQGVISQYSGNPELLVDDDFLTKNAAGEKVPVTAVIKKQILTLIDKDPLIEVVEEDPAVMPKYHEFTASLAQLKQTVVGHAQDDLIRGPNRGPGILMTDAMLWKTKNLGVNVALLNSGGARDNIFAGPITVDRIYAAHPFGNTLVIVELSGQELLAVLDENSQLYAGKGSPPYVSGMRFSIDKKNPKGKRITELQIRAADHQWVNVDNHKLYKIVIPSFLANGGDYNDTLKNAKNKLDTGFIDAEILIDYVKGMKVIKESDEVRIKIIKK